MVKVVKFGGSSLASAGQFKKAGEIIRADAKRKYVIPSAPGKRHAKDIKVTDMLYDCYELAESGEDMKPVLRKIRARYNEIINGLKLQLNLDEEFKVIENRFLEKAGRDYAASRGEYLNGIIMADYLGYEFIDAAEVIRFDDQGERTAEKDGTCGDTGILWYEGGWQRKDIFQRRIGYYRFHCGKGMSCGFIRKLDGCIRVSGGRSQDY